MQSRALVELAPAAVVAIADCHCFDMHHHLVALPGRSICRAPSEQRVGHQDERVGVVRIHCCARLLRAGRRFRGNAFAPTAAQDGTARLKGGKDDRAILGRQASVEHHGAVVVVRADHVAVLLRPTERRQLPSEHAAVRSHKGFELRRGAMAGQP